MRISTKLNIYLGARHAISDMLPDRLSYLKSYFRTDRTSGWFYVSLSAAPCFWDGWSHAAATAATGHDGRKWTLLACFAALALLEHLFLVLPVRDSALWAWAMERKNKTKVSSDRQPGQFGRKSLTPDPKTTRAAARA
jgi:putative photosynthetic complex assembly protein 2